MLPQLSKELQRNTRPVRHPWSSVLTVANVDTLGANVQVLLTVSAARSLRKITIPPRIQEEGKLYTDREGPSRDDTNARGLSCQPSGSLATTRSATAGSSGVDVETAVNIKGPLGFGLSAFLMGQSSTALEGILVLPGLIDADYCGTVKIMIHVLIPPVSIPKGTRIAQLVPFRSCVPKPGEVQRGDGGLGSTGKLQAERTQQSTGIMVMYKDPESGKWCGSAEVKLTGRSRLSGSSHGFALMLDPELSQWQLARHRRVLKPLIRQILTNRVLLADTESFREVFRTVCLIVYRTCFR
ncbi:uncharacterized protein LOC126045238 isoform X2 [Accipiter gentilis]|uniref:uncharacterized protein LOC126045238 isoform X2 n=1 Tax=Astur gentilis TaxID=8957 RepID=UPI002110915C|nr:uncharacterized protein LOC126045238 isoform X2 [Accipiter gentilis]